MVSFDPFKSQVERLAALVPKDVLPQNIYIFSDIPEEQLVIRASSKKEAKEKAKKWAKKEADSFHTHLAELEPEEHKGDVTLLIG